MKIILFLALITLATCELYHYQECVRGTTVLLKEPCSSGTYEGNSPFHPLADNKLCFLAFLLFLVLIMLIIFWFSLELQGHNEICHA